jgi:hypothetical protein
MSLFQDLTQAAKDQGISLDWTFQPRTQAYGSEGNSALDYGVDLIEPTITYNGVNYSYNPSTQTFSSGGEETKDPNTGWGRTYDLTTPEGTTQYRQRSRSKLEIAAPALAALTGVLGLGVLGPAGLGMFGGEAAAAGGIAPELIGGGLGSGLEVAAAVPEFAAGNAAASAAAAGAAEGVPAYFSTGLGDTALANFGGTSLAGPSSGLPSLSSGSSLFAPTLADAAASFGAAPLTLSGAQDALYNAATSGPGMTSTGAGGSSGLPSLKPGSESGSGGLNDLLKLLVAGGLGYAASKSGRSELKPVGGKGPDPKARRWDPETKTYYSNSTGERIYKAAGGGISGLPRSEYRAGGRYLQGPGDGMSDNIKANIDGVQEARLADGEFVIPADVVSHIGNGSSNAGAKKLHDMMNRIRRARTGNPKQGKQIKAEKYLPV